MRMTYFTFILACNTSDLNNRVGTVVVVNKMLKHIAIKVFLRTCCWMSFQASKKQSITVIACYRYHYYYYYY